jgi:hypothetical protein
MLKIDDINPLGFQASVEQLRSSLAFEMFFVWLADQCFMDKSAIVPGDPLQTYANEHLRDMILEVKNLVYGDEFKPTPQPTEVNDNGRSDDAERNPARWYAFGRFFGKRR